MLRRSEDHVFESSKDMRTDHVALVRSGKRRDEDLRARRDAQVIRPEGDEALDEGAIARDARLERRARLACRELDEMTTGFTSLLCVSLARHSQATDGVTDDTGRRDVTRMQRRRAAVELRFQPASGIGDSLTLTPPGAKSESIECAKCDVHTVAASRSGNANSPCSQGLRNLESKTYVRPASVARVALQRRIAANS